MTNLDSPAASRRSLKRWWAAAVVLLLIGVGFLTVDLLGHQDALTRPAAAPPSSADQPAPTQTSTPPAKPPVAPSAKPAARPAAVVSHAAPMNLRIPAIGVSLRLSTLGLNSNGTVQVPVRDQQPGWFRLGPAPGQMGSAVILGHVDDYRGPAAFYRVKSLRPGDKVDVTLADGRVAHFAVKKVATYLKTQFPAQQVYASHGYSALQLVTCGGKFNSSTGHYLSNVVAYTALVDITPAGRR